MKLTKRLLQSVIGLYDHQSSIEWITTCFDFKSQYQLLRSGILRIWMCHQLLETFSGLWRQQHSCGFPWQTVRDWNPLQPQAVGFRGAAELHFD